VGEAGMKNQLVPISERALLARVNRKLAPGMRVKKTIPNSRAGQDLGTFYQVDLRRNFVIRKDLDLAALGRELGVLADYEALVEE
jgi:hypothetical protein